MSEKGQTEKSGKSASPPTPDIVNAGWHVSKVPGADLMTFAIVRRAHPHLRNGARS
jgi:hypothetical protein